MKKLALPLFLISLFLISFILGCTTNNYKDKVTTNCEDKNVPPGATLKEKQYWINLCYQENAIQLKDIDLCEKMGKLEYTQTNTVTIDKCRFEVLKLRDDFKIDDCNILGPGEFKDDCMAIFAQKSGDITTCENIASGYDKAVCIGKIAYSNNDVSLCGNIDTANDQFGTIKLAKNDCYRALAILNKNPTLCDNIPRDSTIRTDCYMALAKDLKRPELCDEAIGIYNEAYISECKEKADQNKSNEAQGYNPKQLPNALLQQGYPQNEVD